MAIATALRFRPVHPLFGVEVDGVDLRRVDDETFGRLRAAFEEHSVLVFHEQRLTDDEQIAFSQRFGPLEDTSGGLAHNEKVRPEIADLSNVDPDGNTMSADDRRVVYHSANQMWHTDSSFKRVPALASLLSGRECPPEGGETEFASMRAAYALLSDADRRLIEGRVAMHSFAYSRGLVAPDLLTPRQQEMLPPVPQAMVRTNPVNERRAYYVASHASHVVDMPVEEGRALIRRLIDFATAPERVYCHHWTAGDLVMWDNRCMLHRGRPWDHARYRRVMHRTTVAGEGPTA